ncbi:hypothetical protein GBF38_018460, partial [Nibea albiflora]
SHPGNKENFWACLYAMKTVFILFSRYETGGVITYAATIAASNNSPARPSTAGFHGGKGGNSPSIPCSPDLSGKPDVQPDKLLKIFMKRGQRSETLESFTAAMAQDGAVAQRCTTLLNNEENGFHISVLVTLSCMPVL